MPIYLKYDGVPGSATAAGHEKWIEVNSFQWGVGRGISAPTGGEENREASAPSVSEITVSKLQDVASAKLLLEALHGEGKTVTIDFVKTDKDKLETYLQYTLTNTMISGYSLSSGGDRPSETLSLNFTKVEFSLTPHKATGAGSSTERAGYDIGLAKVI